MYRDLELSVVVRYLPGGQIVHMHSFPILLVPLRFVPYLKYTLSFTSTSILP